MRTSRILHDGHEFSRTVRPRASERTVLRNALRRRKHEQTRAAVGDFALTRKQVCEMDFCIGHHKHEVLFRTQKPVWRPAFQPSKYVTNL